MAQAVTTYADLRSAMENGEMITVASQNGDSTMQYDGDNVFVANPQNAFNLDDLFTQVSLISVPASKSDNLDPPTVIEVTSLQSNDTFNAFIVRKPNATEGHTFIAFGSEKIYAFSVTNPPNEFFGGYNIGPIYISNFEVTLTRSGGSAASSGDPYVCAMLQ